MNGGVHHAVQGLSPEELAAAVAGYSYFGLAAAGEVLTSAAHGSLSPWTDESEEAADHAYWQQVPDDGVVARAFEAVHRERPEEFAGISRPPFFVIPFDTQGMLAIAPRPRGGDWLFDDLVKLGAHGIEQVVSLLEAPEAQELGLGEEAHACRAIRLAFLNMPVPDLGVPPDFEPFGEVVAKMVGELRAGRRIAVHCRQSVGRSGLLAVAIGVAIGLELHAAIAAVSTARGVQVPETAAQSAWLTKHAAQLARLGA
jgi:protein-tyrosine phosphatase